MPSWLDPPEGASTLPFEQSHPLLFWLVHAWTGQYGIKKSSLELRFQQAGLLFSPGTLLHCLRHEEKWTALWETELTTEQLFVLVPLELGVKCILMLSYTSPNLPPPPTHTQWFHRSWMKPGCLMVLILGLTFWNTTFWYAARVNDSWPTKSKLHSGSLLLTASYHLH